MPIEHMFARVGLWSLAVSIPVNAVNAVNAVSIPVNAVMAVARSAGSSRCWSCWANCWGLRLGI